MIINDIVFNADCLTIINELKRHLDANHIPLLSVIRDSNDDVMISCPFHKGGQEQHPSMGVRKSDGLCHCFACSTTVGLPQMISYCLGDEQDLKATGWNWLLKNFLYSSIENRAAIKLDFSRQHDSSTKYISEDELDTYRYIHPYMYKRKLTDEIIELFDIGYDKKTNCITFPVRDMKGNALFVARRSVSTKYFNYPAGAEKPVYGIYELYCQPVFPMEILICESMLDALTAWVYGKFAVALNGLGTDFQFAQLRALPCRKYILSTDMDYAGLRARGRIKKGICNKIITEYVWDVHQAKDLNDMSKDMFDNLEEIF